MDFTENDFKGGDTDGFNGARYGRPIAAGEYDLLILAGYEDYDGDGNPKAKLVVAVDGGDKSPEGAVKIDYYLKKGTSWHRNFLEVFAGGAKSGKIDVPGLAGARCRAVVKMEAARKKPDATPEQIADGTGFWPSRAQIVKLKGPVTLPKAKAASVASDDDIPF